MELENGFGEYESKCIGEEHLEAESDLPPEYCHYRDEGCEMAASCLNCPFQQCLYEPGGRQRWLKKLRDREIIRLFAKESRSVKELALIFGLSQRTIQRALKSSLSKPSFRRQAVTTNQRKKGERAE